MKTMYIRQDNRPDYSPENAIEALQDIMQAANFKLFNNIELDTTGKKPILKYHVITSDTQIIKEFNPETFTTDIFTFLFSMLDASANL